MKHHRIIPFSGDKVTQEWLFSVEAKHALSLLPPRIDEVLVFQQQPVSSWLLHISPGFDSTSTMGCPQEHPVHSWLMHIFPGFSCAVRCLQEHPRHVLLVDTVISEDCGQPRETEASRSLNASWEYRQWLDAFP